MSESPALVRQRRIFRDIFYLAIDTFRANRAHFLLASLGTIISTVSLIWVVTISLTGGNIQASQIPPSARKTTFATGGGTELRLLILGVRQPSVPEDSPPAVVVRPIHG
jgi:hypothetical protein